ncbi:DUF488 family protein [Siphonobacter sp. BAB-5385]|uniref:DUF488 family protein n=1 Tax=Siphonobacter sp. BAB-5385 TaxID=1864822 RepID=UPI00159531B4|nr:DUF488 family protein [Siphonobacter sp. BAB-5385]
MRYYRRKVLLAILTAFGGKLGKINLQKLLLIFTKLQSVPTYEFLPYRYGCFSFQANWDMRALKAYKIVEEHESEWVLNISEDYRLQLKQEDKDRLKYLVRVFKDMKTDDLIRYTYLKYPYYAIRSEMAPSLLSEEELDIVRKQRTVREDTTLFTIGYEGISLERYINKLILNGVKVLCDVRRNPLSQKVGFSKSELSFACEASGIKYMHFPQLGIPSEKRQNLTTQKDYDILFKDFEENYLVNRSEDIRQVFEILKLHDRIALTCFEASYMQCHRSKVAKAITELPYWIYNLKHL